ncbi:hypothetical protein AVEN_226404-1 [Araneus ventricosus]|uniref:Uncharacterized protein n=1 Tax=Araneus ventricosus TaxID=182803 RepID=A0A4Y2GZ68_ARAVE|nr:hypothetical protein AVEN_226404-1 [Araneus ventricosus]
MQRNDTSRDMSSLNSSRATLTVTKVRCSYRSNNPTGISEMDFHPHIHPPTTAETHPIPELKYPASPTYHYGIRSLSGKCFDPMPIQPVQCCQGIRHGDMGRHSVMQMKNGNI